MHCLNWGRGTVDTHGPPDSQEVTFPLLQARANFFQTGGG
jgi:hypothetical protein